MTNYPKTQCLKTANICYLTVSMHQKFTGSLAEWPWLRVSHESVVSMWVGAAGSIGARGSAFMMVDSLTWLQAGGLNYWPSRLLCRAAGVSYHRSQLRLDYQSYRPALIQCGGDHLRTCMSGGMTNIIGPFGDWLPQALLPSVDKLLLPKGKKHFVYASLRWRHLFT